MNAHQKNTGISINKHKTGKAPDFQFGLGAKNGSRKTEAARKRENCVATKNVSAKVRQTFFAAKRFLANPFLQVC